MAWWTEASLAGVHWSGRICTPEGGDCWVGSVSVGFAGWTSRAVRREDTVMMVVEGGEVRGIMVGQEEASRVVLMIAMFKIVNMVCIR